MPDPQSAVPVIVLCADDYGLTPGVSAAIRELLGRERLTATGCMTISPFWGEEAPALRPFARTADIGLHFTLTDQRPLGPMPRLAPDGRFPDLGRLIRLSLSGGLDAVEISAELGRQIDAFEDAFGAPPAFIDGHHHVHQLPMVGEVLLATWQRRLASSGVYVRYASEPLLRVAGRGVARFRAAVIALLGRRFARLGRAMGVPGNRSFRGVRDFVTDEDYAQLFDRFLAPAQNGALIMCHPGHVDAELAHADSLTTPRQGEFDFLMSEEFPRRLAVAGVRLGRFADCRLVAAPS